MKTILSLAAVATLFCACSSGNGDSATLLNADTTVDPAPDPYSDLKVFELRGPVQQCDKTTFYAVDIRDNEYVVTDTAAAKTRTVTTYFDRIGNYVPSSSELIQRDADGRMTYWRDARANVKGVHPGVLRDTLHYRHLNGNVLETSGMGEYALAVYDNGGRIVGQYAKVDGVEGATTTAFNVFLDEDDHGNWTRRVTIWTSHAPGSKPHVTYTLDKREIKYYAD